MSDCRAHIEPRMLTWAREKAGLSPDLVDIHLGTLPGTCADWEQGTELTVGQALEFAEACGVSFTVLFLPEPPKDPGPLEFQEALETVLEYAHEGLAEEERMRGGREGFVRRYGTRHLEAMAMVEAWVKARKDSSARDGTAEG